MHIVCMYICIYVCMHVCMYVCMYAVIFVLVCMYVCMCVYVCMYVCIYVIIYIYSIRPIWKNNISAAYKSVRARGTGLDQSILCSVTNPSMTVCAFIRMYDTTSIYSWFFRVYRVQRTVILCTSSVYILANISMLGKLLHTHM